MNDKIQATHRARRAAVYLRQSTLRQLVAHPESTRRQYALRARAEALGWRAAAIDVIDDDLGQSGAETRRRAGFRRLCDHVARGLIGAIFVLELSRLTRSSTDWHRLLDLCGVADVVLVDEEAIYHPADANDRLLLGIKGTMSEAERGWIQLRLRGARLSKARRGEYRLAPPAGYVWDRATARLRLDPDTEVQGAVRLVFERFAVSPSAYAVVRYFVEHGLRLPARSQDGASLRWCAPRPTRVHAMLHNPTYAGAYVFGRRTPRAEIVDGSIVRHSARVPLGEWQILHRDHHPAYVTWEQFMANQQTLSANHVAAGGGTLHGVPRGGEALLQGLVLCGRCGHRMHTAYSGRKGRYVCANHAQQGHTMQICWSVAVAAIDARVSACLLDAVAPEAIALGIAVSEEAAAQVATLDRQWALRIERARYEAHLAERRYKAVDPDHRTVVQTLEREWETALQAIDRLEHERETVREQAGLALSAEDRARVVELSRDVPALWHAPTTTPAQRKSILRALVRGVCLTPRTDPAKGSEVQVLWQTGAVTNFVVPQQLPGRHTATRALEIIRTLVSESATAAAIASALRRAGLRTASGQRWTKQVVHSLCAYHDVRWPTPMPTCLPQPLRRRGGDYSTRGVAKLLRVTPATVGYWVSQRWLVPVEGGTRGHPRWFRLDAEDVTRLRRLRQEHTGPRGRAA
jgi:DNA invertase Pin-like site-specific DNA recombinase